MITLEDCLAFCGLSEEEVLAIAEHEHIPEATAAGLGQYLLCCPDGPAKIRDMIIDDIRAARHAAQFAEAHHLVLVLRHFLAAHPEARATRLQRA